MNRFICILRGINVGGHRKILMKDLLALLEVNGYQNVKTYIQSGNVAFDTNLNSEKEIQDHIKELIFNKYEFDVPVIAISTTEIEVIIKNFPFEDDENTHVTFLKELPLKEGLDQINSKEYLPEQLIIKDKVVYLKCVDKYHKTKLSNQFFEKKLKTSATTRNWKTVNKLLEIAKA